MAAVGQFAFEGGEKTLAHGVVEAIAYRTHRRPHARLITTSSKGQRSILAALVGMMDYGGGTTLAKGHIERCED